MLSGSRCCKKLDSFVKPNIDAVLNFSYCEQILKPRATICYPLNTILCPVGHTQPQDYVKEIL